MHKMSNKQTGQYRCNPRQSGSPQGDVLPLHHLHTVHRCHRRNEQVRLIKYGGEKMADKTNSYIIVQ